MKNKTIKLLSKVLCLVMLAGFVLETPLLALMDTIPVLVGGQKIEVSPGQWLSVKQGTETVYYNVRYVDGKPVALEMSQYVKLIFGEGSGAAAGSGAASSGNNAQTGASAPSGGSSKPAGGSSKPSTGSGKPSTGNSSGPSNSGNSGGSAASAGNSSNSGGVTTGGNSGTPANTGSNVQTGATTEAGSVAGAPSDTAAQSSGKKPFDSAAHPRDPKTGRFIKRDTTTSAEGSSQSQSNSGLPTDADGIGLPAGGAESGQVADAGQAGQAGQSGQVGQTGDAAQAGQSGQVGDQIGQTGDAAQAGQAAQAGESKPGFKDKMGEKFHSGYETGKAMTNQGFQNVKTSLKSGFSPQNILMTAGITVGVDLATQVMNGENPSVKKALKTVCSAEFAGGVVGSVTGAAAGSFFVPFLSAVPVVGGVLSALAPTFGSVVGGSVGSYLAGDLKNGKFSIRQAFKQIDWVGVGGQTVGSVLGTMIGSMIFPPFGTIIGGMVGGYLGNVAAHKIAGLFDKDGKVANVAMPTGNNPLGGYSGTNGSVTIGNQSVGQIPGNSKSPTNDAAVVVTIPGDSSGVQIGTYDSEVQLAYAKYCELYNLYNELIKQGRQEDAQKVVPEMNSAKAAFDQLKAKSSK